MHYHPLEFRFGCLIPFWRSSGYGMHIAAASAKQAGPLERLSRLAEVQKYKDRSGVGLKIQLWSRLASA